MTDAPVGWLIAVAGAAILIAGLLSAGEAAVRHTARPATGGATAGARGRYAALLSDPTATTTAAAAGRVLLEITAVVALMVALAAIGMSWWQVVLGGLAVVGVVAAVLIRYAPRSVGSAHPAGTLAVAAPALVIARAIAAPLQALGRVGAERRPTEVEFREMVDQVSESELIEPDEREMFRSVLELGDTITRAVMVPRTEMITLASGTRLRTALSLFLRSGYSRVPVVGASVDDLIGVLYLKDVVRRLHTVQGSDDVPVDDLVRTPVFVPESKPVDDLLRELQQGASHLAIVVDEFGGIAGLVTIEDALEEIVGELTDEHDRTGPEVEDLGDGVFRVPSRLPLDELGELFGASIDDDDVDTAGGLLAKALGKVPLVGSSATVGGLRLTADRVEGRRKQVATVIAQRAASAGRDDDVPVGEDGAR
jgi:CBS domain containing-hemolysin-like protein